MVDEPAGIAVGRLIENRHAAAFTPSALEILQKMSAARHYDAYELRDIKAEFPELVSAWPELNRAFFWFEVEKTRHFIEKRGNRLTDFWQASLHPPFWQFVIGDFDDVISDIKNRPERDDKLVALSVAFKLYVQNDRPRAWRDKLKTCVGNDPELSDKLSKCLKPPAQGKEAREWKKQEGQWKRRAEQRQRKEQKFHADWKDYISKNVELLRDPKLPKLTDISRAQWYLHEQMREKDGTSGRWSGGKWQAVSKAHGDAAALAYRDGAVAYWRRNKPTLRSEGAPPNSTPITVIFGLSGLEIEARETPNWSTGLNETEVQHACRYAAYELNGFPTWFPKLFEAHPNVVVDFLLREIQYELSIEKIDEETHYILSDVSWSGEWSWDTIGPRVHALLKCCEPKSLANLTKLLAILQGSSVPNDDLKSLASGKVFNVEPLQHAAHWFAVWVGVDSHAAIPVLKDHLENITTEGDRSNFAMIFITNLCMGRRREPRHTRKVFQTPQHLKSLYLLIHQFVRQKDDIDRAGKGVYSSGLRDDAQDSRDSLIQLLNSIPGKDAFIALEEISRSHPEQSSRPWFIYLAKRKAEQDADICPWSPAQVRVFNDQLERTPTNHRDLADLAIMRFLDLKDDLENGDSSVSGILKTVSLEPDMRKFIGRELREKALGRYAIPQEEELADAKKPDLRFHGITFDGPVPVELKLADNWTGPALFERLENQLCADYLRDNRSSRGLFVLVYRGEKAAWDTPGEANRVDFTGLVTALQSHWQLISPNFPGVEEVAVLGIDLTNRRRD